MTMYTALYTYEGIGQNKRKDDTVAVTGYLPELQLQYLSMLVALAGVYSLVTSHLASILLNWKEDSLILRHIHLPSWYSSTISKAWSYPETPCLCYSQPSKKMFDGKKCRIKNRFHKLLVFQALVLLFYCQAFTKHVTVLLWLKSTTTSLLYVSNNQMTVVLQAEVEKPARLFPNIRQAGQNSQVILISSVLIPAFQYCWYVKKCMNIMPVCFLSSQKV